MVISNPLLPSSQVASFKNQQLGGLLTGSGSGISTPQMASLGALQSRSQSPVQALNSKIGDSVAAGNQRLNSIYASRPQRTSSGGGSVGVDQGNGSTNSAGWVSVGNNQFAAPIAAAHLKALQNAASGAGYRIGVTEAGRTNARQAQLYNLYKAGKGNLAAAPGHSVHETGRAFDLNGYGGGTNSPQFKWLLANAKAYGFKWTGGGFSQQEPWHWEYVG